MIDNLTHPNPHRPASALQDIIEAETFYAPLLEQLKLDAMASKLRTESKKLRYTRSGVNAEYEATAIDTLDMIRRNGSEEIIAALFGKHTHEVEFKTIAVSDGEPTLFGSGTLRNAEFDFRDIHYRAKSIGSHIDKLERFNGEEILDAFGITVVVGSDENIAEKYVDTVAKLLDNPVVELVAAPSKKKPGYVQGSPTYVGQVESQARKLGIVEHLQIKPKENAPDLYSVCKVTLKVTLPCGDIVPVEIQMLTDKDREGARVGLQAHNLYKQYERRSEQNVDPLVLVKYLKDISRRRDKIDSEGVLANNGSLARSETLLSTIDEQLSYALAV